MVGIGRLALVTVGFAIAQLRRIPGVAWVLRHGSVVGLILAAAAAIAFVLWASQVAPQRVSLADLVQAKLSPMQTWIIVAGDVTGGDFRNGTYRYVLTDPEVPNARMNVLSEVQLPLGRTLVSGTYVGGLEPLPVGFRWIGTMRADAVLATDPGPPWPAILLGGLALFLGLGGRFSYPTFFGEAPPNAAPRASSLAVGVRRGTVTAAGPVETGALRLRPGVPVGLSTAGGPEQPLRLYSARGSIEVGVFQSLAGTEPALRVHQPSGDLDLTFATTADRDAAYAAFAADSELAASARPRPAQRPSATPRGT